jgi:hypothetical protein
MAVYRVYFLDNLGKIFEGDDVDAPGEAAVVATAWNLLEAHNASQPAIAYGCEIWLGRDLVFNSWDPPKPRSP